jgi:hypothetical protein
MASSNPPRLTPEATLDCLLLSDVQLSPYGCVCRVRCPYASV